MTQQLWGLGVQVLSMHTLIPAALHSSGFPEEAPCAGDKVKAAHLTTPALQNPASYSPGIGLLSCVGGREADLGEKWAGHHPSAIL